MSIWTLLRQARSGAYTVHGDVGGADCAIGFAFGAIQEQGVVCPGFTNEALARFAVERLGRLPLILQWEIADALPPSAAAAHRIAQHRQAGRYLDTREVAEQGAAIMQANGWGRAVLLAHGHHLPRVDAVCRKLGIETVAPAGLESIPFCPQSVQPWTRGARAWFRREVPAIGLYWWKGWL